MKPPTRHKDPADYTPGDHLKAIQAERRGGEFKPETTEYAEYRADALRAAGLDDEADAAEPDHQKALEDMTAADHLADIRGGR